MKEKPTAELEEELYNGDINQLDNYYKNNNEYLAGDDRPFYYYVKEILKSKRIQHTEVFTSIGMDLAYGNKLITMEKHTKNRDKIIGLCIGGHFSIEETKRALKLYGMSELYVKDKRDACICVHIKNRNYDIDKINDDLKARGFEILSIYEE